MIIGYTTGVFDLFHIGHVNLLRNAKALCDKLIVGVTVDELVLYKGKRSVIPFHERIQVVQACKFVDVALPQNDMDKLKAVKKYHANVLFVGDDWYDTDKWNEYEKQLLEVGCKTIYFPYTQGTSSSLINSTLLSLRKKQ
ncbi:adenylyltransferase/cytidyltransferase family protein [Citrobacter portucalensis]|jgi:choline-phosphate cytidylyltransferase/glycerol-3-phosphate cytidylyltransferase|uniref:adenylyltransferase/cytidyltransferase family protein n=1 Tax=Citrobacter portucalensis TaxID=1639133 RepID=UPI0015EAD46A|nr:adenylyltransferase/cytidyltransferase family protein [Citrobacter portucalensis]MBA8420586.1 adenylyltransferase/cytidyltransferase family protein [Citrobacter freundii]MDE9614010.1 adenylyltransferase/cytidyltransferase family protein [Citrobacter portucalensis]QMM94529.1 adenylyltransferase/cytidyltransferase family protein [Citrobacter freundii]WFZ26235.1 adenylyltransferase/cytidyltransferase family protein [Citrobacter portucalensis]